jgi:hypothetical protein
VAESAAVDFPLVQDGRAVARVVVAGDYEPLQAAVKDLQAYVQRISGTQLDMVQGAEDLPGPTLHIGETTLYPRLSDAIDKRVKTDGFAIARVGEDLLVTGTMPQGTANGVMTLLQDHFGVRWYYPGELWEVVPQSRSLAIRFDTDSPDGLYVQNPSFQGRTLWGGAEDKVFYRRMRMTQKGTPLPYCGGGHSLSATIPVKEYGQEHPDYYPLVNGRRVIEGGVHPCFTHPDMPEVFMRYIRKGGRSFGVEDNLSRCQCPRCLAVDGESEPYMGMPNVSESFFQLMAKVAAQAEKEFPGICLGMFAYQLTNAPPETVDYVGKSINIVLCQDTAQHFDDRYRQIDRDMSAQWCRKVGAVSLYDYLGIDYWTPRYFPTIMAGQLRHLADHGVLGYVTHSATMPDSAMPMFYLYYQMLWNARLDADQVIDTMLDDLYGPAAGPVAAFYDHWEACWQRQKKTRWFYGMDDFRAEMTIYTLGDIERGARLLDEAATAAAAADDERIGKRIAVLKKYFAFTHAAARAHDVSMRAIRSNPSTPEEAKALSSAVVDVWRAFDRQLALSEKLPGSSISGWHPKCIRVRAWGLKQQMRDAIPAPLVRWICAAEEGAVAIDPDSLRRIEREFAALAVANRTAIEPLVTESMGIAPRMPRACALAPADVPQIDSPPALNAGPADWSGVPHVEALPWIFRARPENPQIGKYDEPMAEYIVDPPAPADQSMTWQCAWDDRRLYLRVCVRDDRHVQERPADTMWQQDSLQIAFNPNRCNFEIPGSSWDYLMGGYHGDEVEFGISLRGGEAQMHVWRAPSLTAGSSPSRSPAASDLPAAVAAPPSAELTAQSRTTDKVDEADTRAQTPLDPRSLITFAADRSGDRTIYETAIDWRMIKGFHPTANRSFSICLVVNDVDAGERRSAEYGTGVVNRKRPTEFAALRLAR